METTEEERPVTTGYATSTEESPPSERATGVLANEEVAFDLKNDEIVKEEPSERAIGALTTEKVDHDLEDDYLRSEKPSESATGELTTGNNEETTRKTTVNVCNGARCRCLEALPVVVERVNFLPWRKAEGNASVVPAEEMTNSKESDSPTEEIDVPLPTTPEYDRTAGPNVLESVNVVVEDGREEVESTEKPSEVQNESAANWYKKTLAASAEAKRANRDFSASSSSNKEETRAEPGPSGLTESEGADEEVASALDEVVASIVPSSRVAATTVDESRVIANIGVPRADSERQDESAPQALPFRLRTLVRSVVCLLILDEEAKNGKRCPKCHYPVAYPP
ncbi:hypothetical protein PF001_g10198 [Phytophthora fragariae]|uniref:Uncharacterized protein n=1 Tax=Phytophthora fragariae TaxID=53985 RepID=A0A6A4DQS8_9STRA|nr:hypothetical protein PF003_g135 [Phytophthora fragariae]KAE9142134.1 hypothetical protein PF006_g12733 [Phytophthora fragariae]KAE9310432.1 hypothetical protein PF001_g10198 [Phytophthora fragariae]